MKLNERIRNLRLDRRLTQEQVAQQQNVTRQTVSGYEAGRTEPGIDILMKLAEIYGVEIGELVGEAESGRNDSAELAQKRLKRIAKIGAVVFLSFAIISWAIMCGTNRFLPFGTADGVLRIKLINNGYAIAGTVSSLLQIFAVILCVLEIKDKVNVKVWS